MIPTGDTRIRIRFHDLPAAVRAGGEFRACFPGLRA